MDKSKNYEKEIPADYVLVKHVNANNDKKQMTIYTLLSFVPLVIILPLLVLIAVYGCGYDFTAILSTQGAIVLFVTCGVLILYTILHELTHGITYKFYTGSKLTFGFNFVVAFCGVPEIYVRKQASIVALAMPFVVFNLVLIGLTVGLWFVSPLYGVVAGVVLAIHLGGCVGDLHWIMLYNTKFKHCHTLMRDTGPEQWLYIPQAEADQYGIPVLPDGETNSSIRGSDV